MSSFFTKPKQVNGKAKYSGDKKRKRKAEKVSKRDEDITSSEDEGVPENDRSYEASEDEYETAQEKKLRLAKLYLKEIEREEKQRLEDQEISKELISKRLRDDHLKQIGKYEITVADKYSVVNENDIKRLKYRAQKNTITCLCISSDDKYIFSGSKDGVVVKWCLKEMKKVGIIPFTKINVDRINGHTSCINALAISTDCKFLAVADNSKMIFIWNPNTLEHIHTFSGHKKPVTGLIFRQNSHTLYSCSEDKSIRVWSLDEMAFVEHLFGHEDTISSIDALHTERPVSAGGRDGTVRLWKVEEGSQLIFNSHPSKQDTIKLINDKFFISGGDDGQINIWNCLKKKAVATAKAAHGVDPSSKLPYWISSVTALPHSDLVASGSQDGYVRLWKLGDRFRTISEILKIPIPGFVNALTFTSDGKYLIAGCGRDHRLGRWSTVKTAKNCIYVISLIRNE